jgi:hypothetical protein
MRCSTYLFKCPRWSVVVNGKTDTVKFYVGPLDPTVNLQELSLSTSLPHRGLGKLGNTTGTSFLDIFGGSGWPTAYMGYAVDEIRVFASSSDDTKALSVSQLDHIRLYDLLHHDLDPN